jgi:pyruvate,orthophosphate dikinase
MAGDLELPVPPGFTITTEACRAYRARGWSDDLEAALRGGVAGIETVTGLGFGQADRPLLLSVRSGAPASMPGMLDSVLDLGWNVGTSTGLAQDGNTFAQDCRRRFEQSFRATVGSSPPDDPWEQLFSAVEAVFRSVDSRRAAAYREREGLDGEILTAVNIQAMVFGNRDERSATGVVFSRNPATGEPDLYGDLLFDAQGEDIVSGRHRTESIAALERRLPEVATQLRGWLGLLEGELRDLCEVEFTIESGKLWLLQVRAGKRSPRAALRIARDFAEDPNFPLDRREATLRVREWLRDPPKIADLTADDGDGDVTGDVTQIGVGIGASPGIAAGEVVVDAAQAVGRAAEGRAVILVRPETSPSDVEGMARAAGLLTARGGLASHAAVVARGWGIAAVVGLEGLEIDSTGFTLEGRRIDIGETISLDGRTGRVYAGAIAARDHVVPEAEIFRTWAQEFGVEIEVKSATATKAITKPDHGRVDTGPREIREHVNVDAFLHILSIRGSATIDALAEVYSLETSVASALFKELEAQSMIAPDRMLGWTLTEAGRSRVAELLQTDQLAAGRALAEDALDGFQPLDARFKQAVTDWQLRTVEDELAPNDHQDPDWDRSVFARLSLLGAALGPGLAMLSHELPRLAHYQNRFGRALEAAQDGDGRYVASPRVDSMHGVWFELHEDLIRLADSTRAEELAAGRAG